MMALLVAGMIGMPATSGAQPAERANTPPGESRDGSRPADGAIKGGSILPGETSGIPRTGPAVSRCADLEGVLREQCLRQEQAVGAGATAPGPAAPPSPREAPPPQRPR